MRTPADALSVRMLHSIRLVDFANHRDTRLTFGRMTALVGPNGAGKTKAMQAIGQASRALREGPSFRSSSATRRSKSEWNVTADLQGKLDNRAGTWRIVCSAHGAELFFKTGKVEEDWIFEDLNVGVHQSEELWSSASAAHHPLSAEGRVVSVPFGRAPNWLASYIKTSAEILSGPSYSESIPPALGQDGREFAWVISYLRDTKPDEFKEIEDSLRVIVPAVRRVRTRPVKVALIKQRELSLDTQKGVFSEQVGVIGKELVFDMVSGDDIPASAVSEGTLLSFFLLTAILHLGRNEECTFLLDDVDHGLHPGAQQRLVRHLRLLQETRSNLQIILSTHSPYIVNEFEAKDIWVLKPDAEGIAHCARLDEHPDAERALQVLTTGEFWSSQGEDWVLGEEDASEPHPPAT